jgi:hypothetical protein
MTRRAWLLAALAAVALVGAGCGSSGPSGTANSTGSGSTGTGSGTGGGRNSTGQGNAVKFAECVRTHGVPHFPDPNSKGEFEFGIDVTPAVWGRAVNACKSLQPPGSLSGKRTPKQQSASLRFAQCIRENGVKDFPDPANGQPIIDTTRIPSSEKPGGMTILNAATHKCGHVLAEAAAGQ